MVMNATAAECTAMAALACMAEAPQQTHVALPRTAHNERVRLLSNAVLTTRLASLSSPYPTMVCLHMMTHTLSHLTGTSLDMSEPKPCSYIFYPCVEMPLQAEVLAKSC
jgi:hypothetical protein